MIILRKMTSEKNLKFGVVVAFGITYFISFWLLTIGYFTPYWLLVNITSGEFDGDWNDDHPRYWNQPLGIYNCSSIGLVRPTYNCDSFVFDWFEQRNEHGIKRILGNTFILMTTSVVTVYTNSMMLITAVVYDLFRHSLYMSVLSISFGVLYPMAAVLILVSSYTSDTGFSTMLCTIAGSLMLIFYIGLIVYDQKFIKSGRTSSMKVRQSKHMSVDARKGSHTT